MGGKGSGGKNKKPTAIRKVQGNAGHRALNEHEATAPAGSPVMPKGMSKAAQAFWQELLPIVTEMHVMTRADALALGQLCMNLDRRMQAERNIQKYGITFERKDDHGEPLDIKTNPAVRVASDADRHIRASLQAFGLDPSSRSRISVENPDGKPKDPLDDIISAKTSSDVVQ